ncbi:unnamed protein product [Bursaphelenchus xylophilus]|uniref:Cystinosin homolog n=1 Tax=Bursaphelenchus xylophilus TaxID=6326 RepID=A0A1I7SQ21_BURXY|nr:unnamed protein product [Bursaphelenchus xylophilus]CAG9109507.1 unnamed protein product [Bursaphelenchus xylophilus]
MLFRRRSGVCFEVGRCRLSLNQVFMGWFTLFVLSVFLCSISDGQKVRKLSDPPSKELLSSPTSLSILVTTTDTVTLRFAKTVNASFSIHLKGSNDFVATPHTLNFAPNQTSHVVNVTGVDVVSTTYLEIDKCSAPCPFDYEAFFVPITVYRSQIAYLLVRVTGWIYFFAWSISFYPQIWLNFKRKSVHGLHFDFLLLNTIGFTAYTIYNLAMYFSDSVQDEYFLKDPRSQIPVLLNDVVFAVHALGACIFTVFQCFLYDRGEQRVSRIGVGLSTTLVGIGIIGLACLIFGFLNALQTITLLSYIKMAVTCYKYIPQAVYNFRRQSTIGWSIENLILDFTGGSFSILQMVIVSWNTDDWSPFTGNVVKFLLGLVSMVFDIIFFVQHFCLYRNREELTTIFNDSNEPVDHIPIVDQMESNEEI